MKTWTAIRLEDGKVTATLFVQEDYTDNDGIVHAVTESEDVSKTTTVTTDGAEEVVKKIQKRMKLAMAKHMVATHDFKGKGSLSIK